MRIGLFGGTFNPIHNGHLHIAQEMRTRFPLDRICLIPSATPPHKEIRGLAAAHDRLEMIRLALPDFEWIGISEVELRRGGASYSIDTVNYFHARKHATEELFLLVGLDAFLELDTWRDYLDILRLIPLIVMPRPMDDKEAVADAGGRTADFIHAKLSSRYVFDSSQDAYVHPYFKSIHHPMRLAPLRISSTQVRQSVRNGERIDALVPAKVEAYIYQKGLYR
jgi:nicotinate-nucleotide adenylyltransferase